MKLLFSLFVCLRATTGLAALEDDEDVADVPSQDLRVGKDENKRYFQIGPMKGAVANK